MARDFDNFPTYDPVIRDEIYLSSMWADFMATFVETLQGYLSQSGMFVPVLTQAQQDAIQNPVEGQMIYVFNTSLPGMPRTAQLQIWKVTAGVGQWNLII
jgi:hypothetical protein